MWSVNVEPNILTEHPLGLRLILQREGVRALAALEFLPPAGTPPGIGRPRTATIPGPHGAGAGHEHDVGLIDVGVALNLTGQLTITPGQNPHSTRLPDVLGLPTYIGPRCLHVKEEIRLTGIHGLGSEFHC